jgi:hypothetical protein
MPSVSINPPKTPVTEGSLSIAKATLPNMCKMPGPPAPFVPTPLPNIGKSSDSPQGYSTSVTIEGNAVAIKGASFNSLGDIASKGLGGGMVSMNTQGPTTFVGPGSMDVKIEGKNVQLLGDPMLNNCGPSGTPANSATMGGVKHASGSKGDAKAKCAKLKAKYGVETGTHKANTSGATKLNSRSYQSHHIIQDKSMPQDICSRAAAQAVMLFNSCKGTQHGDITASQKSREAKKGGPGGPGTTFGAVKKQAEGDLAKALEGKKTPNGKTMSKKDAKAMAKCLVMEADSKAKEQAKRNKKKLNGDTVMDQPGGCFVAGTLVRLADGALQAVQLLRRGDRVQTVAGDAEVTRIDGCYHPLVELTMAEEVLTIASYHRLFDEDGHPVRADALRAGDRVACRDGLREIVGVRAAAESAFIYRLGLSEPSTCLLGRAGVMAEIPDIGPPVVRRETVEVFAPGAL